MKGEAMSSAARSVLQAYRQRTDFAAEREDAAWEQLQGRIDAGEGPRFDDSAAEAPPPRRRVAGWVPAVAITAAAAAVVLGLVDWSSLRSAESEREPTGAQAAFEAPEATTHRAHAAPSKAVVPREVPSPQAPAVEEPEPAQESVEVEAPAQRPPVVPRRPRAKPEAETPRGTASIAAELELLRKAQTALGHGDPQQALRHLQVHARDFPTGSLEPERLGLRAIALCALDRPEGPRLARTFLAAHPQSTLRHRVQTTCVEKSGTTSTPSSRIGTSADK
jgi:hypothetical protein